jgi:hypothetical protein
VGAITIIGCIVFFRCAHGFFSERVGLVVYFGWSAWNWPGRGAPADGATCPAAIRLECRADTASEEVLGLFANGVVTMLGRGGGIGRGGWQSGEAADKAARRC